MAHFAYLITDGLRNVKIGHSAAPAGRLCELQVGSPQPLSLAKTWARSREDAKALERQLHKAFIWCASRGEWFATDWRAVAQVGDIFMAGDVERAAQTADLLRRLSANNDEDQRCRRAWYDAKPKDRRAVEAAAKARRGELEIENARLTLALMDSGFHPPDIGKHHLQVHAARTRFSEIVRRAASTTDA